MTLFWFNICALVAADHVTNARSQLKKFNYFIYFFFVFSALQQPQNVLMGFGCSVSCWFVNQSCNRMMKHSTERTIAKIFLHFWIGKLFYFYQGNSNNFASIDWQSGFVGDLRSHLLIAAILTYSNLYIGQFMSIFLLVIHLNQDPPSDTRTIFFKWLLLMATIPTTIYLMILYFLRCHLFIWSVFAAKLIFNFFEVFVIFIAMLVVKMTVK